MPTPPRNLTGPPARIHCSMRLYLSNDAADRHFDQRMCRAFWMYTQLAGLTKTATTHLCNNGDGLQCIAST